MNAEQQNITSCRRHDITGGLRQWPDEIAFLMKRQKQQVKPIFLSEPVREDAAVCRISPETKMLNDREGEGAKKTEELKQEQKWNQFPQGSFKVFLMPTGLLTRCNRPWLFKLTLSISKP